VRPRLAPRLVARAVAWLIPMLPVLRAPARELLVEGDGWAWTETSTGLRLRMGERDLVTRELIQLIDRSEGWRSVWANSGEPGAAISRLDDGRRGSRWELAADRLKLTREVWVQGGALHLTISCELRDVGAATDFYYSLELPSALLEGGAWRARVDDLPLGALLGPGGGGVLTGRFERLELLGPGGLLAVDATSEGSGWTFQDWRRPPHDTYRLRIELPAEPGSSFSAGLAITAAEGEVEDTDEFLAQIRAETAERLSPAHSEPLAIRAVTPTTAEPAVGRPCELRCDLGAAWDDPFDPGDVSITAQVQTPSRSYELPAFYHVPFERRPAAEADEVTAGAPDRRVRFLPTEPGAHRVTVAARDRTGDTRSGPVFVEVAPAEWKGLLRASEHAPLALVWGAGGQFYPLGVNVFERTSLGVPLPADRTDRAIASIESLAADGGNFIRLRMDAWWFAIEGPVDLASGYLGAGRFNQRACWDIDRIFEACERNGVQVMLCIMNANANVNSPREGWRRRYNVYAADNGGPCEDMADFWTDETSWAMWRTSPPGRSASP